MKKLIYQNNNIFVRKTLVVFLSVVLTIICSLVIFLLGRVALILTFSKTDDNILLDDLYNLFITGCKLDLHIMIKTMGIAILLLVVFYFLRAGIRLLKNSNSRKILMNNHIEHNDYIFFRILCNFEAFILTMAITATVINYYYYRTYGNVIDAFFFNFFNEDLKALSITIIKGYPIVTLLFGAFISFFLFKYMLLKIMLFCKYLIEKLNYVGFYGLWVALLCFTYISYFGGFTTERIRSRAVVFTAISSVKIINDARSNPFALIELGLKEYLKSVKISPIDPTIEIYSKIISDYGLKKVPEKPMESFYAVSGKNEYLELHKPNVVIVYSESLGSYMSSFSSKDFDVLASLKDSLNSDFYFKNFISEGNATQNSLVRFLFRAPYSMLPFHPEYSRKHYETFAFAPYIEQGYDIYFITGSDCKWANLDNILKINGVQHFVCASDLSKVFPEAEYLFWGIGDEYLYTYAENILRNAKVPTLIFILNSTNHPPYNLPQGYHGHEQLNFPEEVLTIFNNYTNEEVKSHYSTYRYASEKLGDFINRIKNTDTTKDNTIIAFTGDHNARLGIFDYRSDSAIRGKGVLFSIYIPKEIVNHQSIFYDRERLGSQKDIMPTLIEHSLSNQRYIRTGCDLLSETPCPYMFGYNEDLLVSLDRTNSIENPVLQESFNDYTNLLLYLFAIQVHKN